MNKKNSSNNHPTISTMLYSSSETELILATASLNAKTTPRSKPRRIWSYLSEEDTTNLYNKTFSFLSEYDHLDARLE